MFHALQQAVVQHFHTMARQPLFDVAIDREMIWHTYLDGFDDPALRQEHTCNACKGFLRHFAGIVTIEEGRVVSLWDDVSVEPIYATAIANLSTYVHACPIRNIFLHTERKGGTPRNFDRQRGITWEHFALTLPPSVICADVDTRRAQARDNTHVLQRSLEELTLDATETVLTMIHDNALYRGAEHEGLLRAFLALQQAYATTATEHKDTFCWVHAYEGGAITRIRNTAIGTLLIDLSAGLDVDAAVGKYERVVAPTHYKRPSAVVTPRMVEDAKATLAHLELLDSLNRRGANETDLNINDLLFVHRPVSRPDVFGKIADEAIVNPRSFVKAEEVSIADFVTQVLPTAQSMRVLLENRHMANFVTLITADDPTVPLLFKWDNPFSWSYTGGITDAIKERVKDAGGNVQGELRVSLAWHNYDDLDLHVHEPNGTHIYYPNKGTRHPSSGMLDVDMNAGQGTTRTPVENIIWTDKHRMPEGTYKVQVHNFARRETAHAGFTVQVESAGQVWEFEYATNPKDQAYQPIIELVYSRQDGVRLSGKAQSSIVQRTKWGLNTSQFHRVRMLMLSPNYWEGNATGNKHYFFMLADCVSDEVARPFYNEFLKQELEVHRKVFEILGSKIPVKATANQLAGIGFSETQRAQVLVQVQGRTTRTMKVTF